MMSSKIYCKNVENDFSLISLKSEMNALIFAAAFTDIIGHVRRIYYQQERFQSFRHQILNISKIYRNM